MERIYIGTTLILLVSCVFILYGTKKDGETIDGLMKELYRLEKLNCDLKSQNNECSSINYGLNFERLDLQRKNRDMSTISDEPFTVEPGMRIAQMVIARYERIQWQQVDELDDTPRGSGGFGHTGT